MAPVVASLFEDFELIRLVTLNELTALTHASEMIQIALSVWGAGDGLGLQMTIGAVFWWMLYKNLREESFPLAIVE